MNGENRKQAPEVEVTEPHAAAEKADTSSRKENAKSAMVPAVSGTETTRPGKKKSEPVSNNQFEEVFKMSVDMFKGYEEAVSFGKDNMEAMAQSGAVFAKGMQDIGNAWSDFIKASLEANMAVAKKAASCKDLSEVLAVQSDAAKVGYDALVKESGKLSGASVKIAEEAWAPLGARVNVAMEKFGKPFAV